MARALLLGAGFFAWHFVLRRGGVRLETRFSARLYAAVVMAWEAVRRRHPLMAVLAALPLAFGSRQLKRGARAHFDDLAPDYAEQLSPAARERVVRRKTALMVDALAGAGIKSPRILDVGCGHGWYIDALQAEGASVTGIDLAPAQLTAARTQVAGNAALAAGSALQLPVAPQRFDAAYAVNVLHHLEDEALQATALLELAQTVRPGGFVFVHEINTRNPLFSFYMSYVFPLWKRIDRGTERWLDPYRLPVSKAVTLEDVRCYTFLPDFAPHSVVRRLESFEHALEHAFPSWSAHFTAIYRRIPSA